MALLPPSMAERLSQAINEYEGHLPLPADYVALTPSQRASVREQYIKQQAGRCHHCDLPLIGAFPPGRKLNQRVLRRIIQHGRFSWLKHPIHLHHSHITGLTIGAVHSYCNAELWYLHGE